MSHGSQLREKLPNMSHGSHEREKAAKYESCRHTTHMVWRVRRAWNLLHFETWLVYVWDMTHLCVSHDSFMCEPWLVYVWAMTRSCMRHDSFMYETWLVYMWPTSCSRVGREWYEAACENGMTSLTVETWLVYAWAMTRSCVGHSHVLSSDHMRQHMRMGWPFLRTLKYDSFMCEPWLIHVWGILSC